MSRRPVPTLRQVERALVRAYLVTRGRGKNWHKVKRAVSAFVARAQSHRVLRLLAYGSTFGKLVLMDLADGKLDGFARVLDEVIRRV